jgi:hypothetical protein
MAAALETVVIQGTAATLAMAATQLPRQIPTNH